MLYSIQESSSSQGGGVKVCSGARKVVGFEQCRDCTQLINAVIVCAAVLALEAAIRQLAIVYALDRNQIVRQLNDFVVDSCFFSFKLCTLVCLS